MIDNYNELEKDKDSSWPRVKIKEITNVTSGGTPSTLIREYWGGEILWMNSGELNLKKVYNVTGRITEKGMSKSSTKLVPRLTVLIGLAGQGKTRGTTAINFVELCINQSIAGVLPSKKHDSMFLYYNLDNRYDELRSLSTGDGGRGGLNLKILRDLEISLPPLDEQKQIANVLSDTDKLIELLEKLIEKKKNIKQGTMQQLLTGKKRLEGYTKSWININIGDYCSITTGKLDANAMNNSGKYRFYTCAKEYYYIDTYAFDTEALLVSGNGANVGYIHYYQGKFNAYQRTYVLTNFSQDIMFIKYKMDIALKRRIEKEVNAGNTPYIKMDTLTKMSITIPVDLEEQKAIAKILSDIDNEIEALEKKLEKYKQIKQGMMQELLTGRTRLV